MEREIITTNQSSLEGDSVNNSTQRVQETQLTAQNQREGSEASLPVNSVLECRGSSLENQKALTFDSRRASRQNCYKESSKGHNPAYKVTEEGCQDKSGNQANEPQQRLDASIVSSSSLILTQSQQLRSLIRRGGHQEAMLGKKRTSSLARTSQSSDRLQAPDPASYMMNYPALLPWTINPSSLPQKTQKNKKMQKGQKSKKNQKRRSFCAPSSTMAFSLYQSSLFSSIRYQSLKSILGIDNYSLDYFQDGKFYKKIRPGDKIKKISKEYKQEPIESVVNLLKGMGYPAKAYTFKTADFRILSIVRLQAKGGAKIDPELPQRSLGTKVILLQHGILDSCDNWIINEESKSLALVLANRGYDVWLGNNRGNKYNLSHGRRWLKPKNFWDFSFQEMGKFDLPAKIEFILTQTKAETLTYIGHSQGATQMFAALSDPKTADFMNSKVKTFVALAPVVYLKHQNSFLMNLVGKKFNFLKKTAEYFGVYSLLHNTITQNNNQVKVLEALLRLCPPLQHICSCFNDLSPVNDNLKRMPIMSKHIPCGVSLKCIDHFMQLLILNCDRDEEEGQIFAMYDLGSKEANLKAYGQEKPPEYDFGLIRTRVRIYVGVDDMLGNQVDNRILVEKLVEEGVDAKMEVFERCGHATFLWGLNPGGMFGTIIGEIEGIEVDVGGDGGAGVRGGGEDEGVGGLGKGLVEGSLGGLRLEGDGRD